MTPSAAATERKDRVFLFLQGPSSFLFQEIADHLKEQGATCWRINLNVGDWIFWRRRGAVNYRGSYENWRGFIGHLLQEKGVTDVIALGEERPYHRIAFEEARAKGAKVYVVEMGYLRPDWVTIEREGMSSNSRFPVDPVQIIDAAKDLPEPDWKPRFRQSFLTEAALDLVYNLPTVFLWFLYPHYRRHALFHPLAEYAGWVRKLLRKGKLSSQAEKVMDNLIKEGKPFFVYPLQLETDYQLRSHSPFSSQREAIFYVLNSFASSSDRNAQLLLKVHPLDNYLIPWAEVQSELSEKLGIKGRVHTIDGGILDDMIRSCRGVVTVNSTAALSAIKVNKPVKVLGQAIYNLEGLTDLRPLAAFWAKPCPPVSGVAESFFRLLAATIQVRGNFYSKPGMKTAANAIAQKILTNSVNEPGGYTDPAPRSRPTKYICGAGHRVGNPPVF